MAPEDNILPFPDDTRSYCVKGEQIRYGGGGAEVLVIDRSCVHWASKWVALGLEGGVLTTPLSAADALVSSVEQTI